MAMVDIRRSSRGFHGACWVQLDLSSSCTAENGRICRHQGVMGAAPSLFQLIMFIFLALSVHF